MSTETTGELQIQRKGLRPTKFKSECLRSPASISISLGGLLPNYQEIQNLLKNEAEAAYILKMATENIKEITRNMEAQTPATTEEATEEAAYLVYCLVDKCWERIHTGHFSEVPLATRQMYAVANYFKIFYMLFESLSLKQVEKCAAVLDEALLIGCTHGLYANSAHLQKELTQFFNNILNNSLDYKLRIIKPLQRQLYGCDIPQLNCPSVEVFQQQYFVKQQPVLLLNTISHWPALEKWHDLNYLLKIAGNRTVPIEIGSNYATDEWSQQLVKICDFLRRQFPLNQNNSTATSQEIEYLAQHELFDQIPELKDDIRIPDYCAQAGTVDIKAWLGPKGTISPMHYDPKHNLLCQVFGAKHIILAAPADSSYLYAHESEFLGNTSRLDAANIDLKQFPLAAQAKFYQLTLQPGDCLYMPPKWWHYVRSKSESFSVSFWWE